MSTTSPFFEYLVLVRRRLVGPQYSDPQYSDPQYSDPQYSDPQYSDPQYSEPSTASQFSQRQFANRCGIASGICRTAGLSASTIGVGVLAGAGCSSGRSHGGTRLAHRSDRRCHGPCVDDLHTGWPRPLVSPSAQPAGSPVGGACAAEDRTARGRASGSGRAVSGTAACDGDDGPGKSGVAGGQSLADPSESGHLLDTI